MRLLRRLQYLLQRNRREQQLAEELAFHRALAERDQRQSGASAEMARRAVNLRMGNTTLAREAAHHVWVPAAIEGIFQDLRYAWRGLSRSKALLVVACLSLGLSTGFGTALVSVVNAVVLQPVTAARPDSLTRLWVGNGNRISWLNLHDICDDTPGVACDAGLGGANLAELTLMNNVGLPGQGEPGSSPGTFGLPLVPWRHRL